MKVSAKTPQTGGRRSAARLVLLVAAGLLAIGLSWQARNSSWTRERRLRALSVEELALAVHDNPRDALTFVYYGRALLTAGNAPAAERALDWAVKMDSKMPDAYRELGRAQMANGKLPDAKQSYQQAISLAPNEPENYLALAKLLYSMGQVRESIPPIQKILALQPRNVYAWYTLGKMYGESHQSDLAYDALKKSVAIDPKQALCWRDLAQVSRHYSRNQEAEQQFQKSLALNDKDPTTHYWLGQLYLEMGSDSGLSAKAQQQLEAAVFLDPTLEQAYFELGRLSERRGDFANAISRYTKARSLDASDDQVLYHLGLCLEKTGKVEEGKALIQGAQALSAAKHDVEDTENRIRTDPQNRALRLRLARLYRKYDDSEHALVEYLTYQRMGVEDAGVARELDAYRAELKRGAASEKQNAPSGRQP